MKMPGNISNRIKDLRFGSLIFQTDFAQKFQQPRRFGSAGFKTGVCRQSRDAVDEFSPGHDISYLLTPETASNRLNESAVVSPPYLSSVKEGGRRPLRLKKTNICS